MVVSLSEQNSRQTLNCLRRCSNSLNLQAADSNDFVLRHHFSDLDVRRDNDRDCQAGGDVKGNYHHMRTLVERQQMKATRVCFYRNLNTFFNGIVVPVSAERYRTFDALLRELTRLLNCRVVLPSGICKIVRLDGTLITHVGQFIENDICVCCCRYEVYKNVGYNIKSQQKAKKRRQFEIKENKQFQKLVLPQLFKDLFEVEEMLKKSFYSDLYYVKHSYWRTNGYVLKYVPVDGCSEYLRNEKSTLLMLQHHDNIIDLLMSYESPKLLVYVFERLHCDLYKLCLIFGNFSDETAQLVVRMLGRGLNYMHNKSIVHRDIKLENVLVNCDNHGNILQLKITDFGLAIVKGVKPLYILCGTPSYMAPEMHNNAGYDCLVDCWSMGVLLFHGLTGDVPFGKTATEYEAIFEAVLNEKYNPNILASMHVNPSLCVLVGALLSKTPSERPNAAEILRSHFANEIL